MVYLVQILYTYVFQHCPATGMKKGDEASPSTILAGQALLLKMLSLEPRYAFGSNFETLFLFIFFKFLFIFLLFIFFYFFFLFCLFLFFFSFFFSFFRISMYFNIVRPLV